MDDKRLLAEALEIAADRHEYTEICMLDHSGGLPTDMTALFRAKAERCREMARNMRRGLDTTVRTGTVDA